MLTRPNPRSGADTCWPGRGEGEPPAWPQQPNDYAFDLCPWIRGRGFRRCRRHRQGAWL